MQGAHNYHAIDTANKNTFQRKGSTGENIAGEQREHIPLPSSSPYNLILPCYQTSTQKFH